MENIKVSVIMPAYNEELYIRKSIQAILNQTLKEIEIIVINDNSSDKTPKIVEKLMEEHDNVRLITNETNLMPARAMNKGIKLARGKYVARMDADDFSLPNRLLRQYELMEAYPDVVVCGTGQYFLNYRYDDYRLVIPAQNDKQCRVHLKTHSPINVNGAMYRKETLLKVRGYETDNEETQLAEGYNLLVKLSEFGKLGNVTSPEYVYFYRDEGNRSAHNNFKGRNNSTAEGLKILSKRERSWKSTIAIFGWRIMHLIPRSLQVRVKKIAAPYRKDIKITEEQVKILESYYKSL